MEENHNPLACIRMKVTERKGSFQGSLNPCILII